MQTYTSKNTDVYRPNVAVVYTNPVVTRYFDTLPKGFTVTDFGSGKYNNPKKYMAKMYKGSTVYYYDKYNRTKKENDLALSVYADVGILSNVLNVIDTLEERIAVLKLVKDNSKIVFIRVQVNSGDKIGRVPQPDCFQANRPLADYKGEIASVYKNVLLKNRIIVASDYDLPLDIWSDL